MYRKIRYYQTLLSAWSQNPTEDLDQRLSSLYHAVPEGQLILFNIAIIDWAYQSIKDEAVHTSLSDFTCDESDNNVLKKQLSVGLQEISFHMSKNDILADIWDTLWAQEYLPSDTDEVRDWLQQLQEKL